MSAIVNNYSGNGGGDSPVVTTSPRADMLSRKQQLSLKNKSSSFMKNSGVLLPFDRFSNWVHSIIVVNFDIELGQSIETIYPSLFNVKLTAQDKLNICYLSFPDSNSGFLGDSQFHFRFKLDTSVSMTSVNAKTPGATTVGHLANNLTSMNLNHYFLGASLGPVAGAPGAKLNHVGGSSNSSGCSSSNTNKYEEYNKKTPTGLEVDENYMFGYVFFRQVKDKSLKRGYFQKSVVLLSQLPFVSLFSYILNLIAVEYFATGNEILETTCHNIDQWPLLVPGEHLSLPILGHLIEVCFPVQLEKYSLPLIYKKDMPAVPITLPPVHEINLYKCLQPILIHIHLLWELILVNEPIVVIANVPSVSSELVQGLVSTIWPLKYASDYRPFFTIHNSEFAEYSHKSSVPPGLVIGVTNPFFTKCLQHWPNIIKVCESNKLTAASAVDGETSLPSTDSLAQASTALAVNGKNTKIKKTNNIRVIDSKPAIYTQYESFLSKDKEIIKRIIRGAESNRPLEAQSAILRRYFMDLTQSFMIPLERYFSTLMPLHKNISPFKSVPKLKDFDADEFMRNLKQAGPELTSPLKGDWPGLYKRFFDSLNFKHWFEKKKLEAEKKLELIQLELLADYDVNNWLKSKQEIEIIDQFMNVKRKIDMVECCKVDANERIKEKLKSILSLLLNSLPEDVRGILATNHQKF